jgi:hypothetical protein
VYSPDKKLFGLFAELRQGADFPLDVGPKHRSCFNGDGVWPAGIFLTVNGFKSTFRILS